MAPTHRKIIFINRIYSGPNITQTVPYERMLDVNQNKKYKKIRVKKSKLKGKKAKLDLLFAADKADLVVDEYCDKVSE